VTALQAPQRSFSFGRAASTAYVGATFSALAGLGVTLLVTRNLGADGAGLVLQVVAAASIAVAFTKLGMDSATIWLVPRLLLSDPSAVRGVVAFHITVAAAAGAVAAAALFGAAALVRPLAGPLADALEIAAPWLPAAGALAVAIATLRALGGTTRYVLWGNIVQPAARLLAVGLIVTVVADAGLTSVAWAAVPAAVLIPVLVATHRAIRRAEDGTLGAFWPERSVRRTVVGFAIPRTLSAGLEQALLWLDVLIVGAIGGSTMAGLYGGASRLIAAGFIIDAALRLTVAPRFSQLLHAGDTAGVVELYRRTTRSLILFGAPVYILLASFAPLALEVLGPEFAPAAPALIVLCLGAIVSFCAGPVHSILLMSGRSGLAAGNKAAVLVINVGIDVVLVPPLGILGAAIGWSVSMVVDSALATFEIDRLLGVRLDAASVALPLALAAACAGGPAAIALLLGGGWALAAAAGGLCLALVVVLSRVLSRQTHRNENEVAR
jgi:O-antigen/teichoic acid export membrane protein